MAVWRGLGEPVSWGDTDCGDVITWDEGWRATLPRDRELLPSSWMRASRWFPTRREAVDWLLAEAGVDRAEA